MSQKLDEQINTLERALGERMITHALVIIHSWLNELGENNPYEEAYLSIQQRYSTLFSAWVSSDDENTDARLDELTGEAYQMADAVYADIRILRGLSPDMHGFNPESPQSVMYYFGSCLRLSKEDFLWLHEALHDDNRSSIGLMAVSSLVKNLRECFSIEGMLAVIDGIRSERELISEQCTAYACTLLIHYDIRIDFFPQIQDAFIKAVREVDPEGDRTFDVLCALVRSTHMRWSKPQKEDKDLIEQLPEDIRSMLAMLNMDSTEDIITWMPRSEHEYMQGLIQFLPDTWLYSVLVADSPARESIIAGTYLSVGRMDLLWNHPDGAEKYLVQCLREGSENPMDYINYGHCLMLKGDRIMAYENYHRARQMCKNAKEFFALFRPDRRQLVEHGVPVEQVYLMEDQLLNI
jgi:hypothetical protein